MTFFLVLMLLTWWVSVAEDDAIAPMLTRAKDTSLLQQNLCTKCFSECYETFLGGCKLEWLIILP
jgi:hypothetical protein